MSNRTNIAAASKDIVFVPLNKLKKSPKNVRKLPHTSADIKAFAASIAALGMLQYPVVEPELGPRGKPTGNYLVNAGEGRRLAQLLRMGLEAVGFDVFQHRRISPGDGGLSYGQVAIAAAMLRGERDLRERSVLNR